MSDLKTTYLGLDLKNPIIVGASDLSSNIENLKEAENAGAAAIVYKSLFEEQIQLESLEMDRQMSDYNERHAEMINLFPDIDHAGPKEYLFKLKKAKESLGIPLIASLNAVFKESWIEYAKLIEDQGVDAIELNFYHVPVDFEKSGSQIEQEQVEIVKEIKKVLNIPVSVKLSPFYSNVMNVAMAFDQVETDGFVLFNKMFQPEVDLEKEEHISPFYLSSEHDYRLALRFAGLMYGHTAASICASGGIYDGKDIIKLMLAGADAVQVVSSLYKKKISHITTMLTEMEEWLNSKSYGSLREIVGKLSRKKTSDPYVYKRAQYIELIMKSGDLTKEYSLR